MNGNYLYVDGESHYKMVCKCWKTIHGEQATLSSLIASPTRQVAVHTERFALHQEAGFFWDIYLEYCIGFANDAFDRKCYFTAFKGSTEGLQTARERIRRAGFEPQVSLEEKDLQKQRANRLRNEGLVIKPKGVDVSLAVRMLEDAYHGNYETCAIATSDIDFMPAIEAVRRMGKKVIVMGFGEGIAKDSPFLYAPDRFIDIGQSFMNLHYACQQANS